MKIRLFKTKGDNAMKVSIFTLCLSGIILFVNIVYSHNEIVHQYIVREAFKLLKNEFPTQLTDMENYVGNDQTVNQGHAMTFGAGFIVSGAYMEDHYDINYHYGLGKEPDYNQTFIPEELLNVIMNETRNYATITHFWKADLGDNAMSFLNGEYEILYQTFYWSFDAENAYQKAIRYLFGGYDARFLYDGPVWWFIDPNFMVVGYDFNYSSLADLYLTGNYHIPRYLLWTLNWIP